MISKYLLDTILTQKLRHLNWTTLVYAPKLKEKGEMVSKLNHNKIFKPVSLSV